MGVLYETGREFLRDLMAVGMKANLSLTRLMETENCRMPMETCTRVNGLRIRLRDRESSYTRMAPVTMDNGIGTCNKGTVLKLGQTVQHLKGITGEAKKMDLASFFGPKAPFMKASSKTTTFMERGSTNGMTAALTRASGAGIKCTERVACPGKTVVITMVNTFRIRSMERAFSLGRTGESTAGNGSMASRMGLDVTSIQTKGFGMANGRMDKKYAGSIYQQLLLSTPMRVRSANKSLFETVFQSVKGHHPCMCSSPTNEATDRQKINLHWSSIDPRVFS